MTNDLVLTRVVLMDGTEITQPVETVLVRQAKLSVHRGEFGEVVRLEAGGKNVTLGPPQLVEYTQPERF